MTIVHGGAYSEVQLVAEPVSLHKTGPRSVCLAPRGPPIDPKDGNVPHSQSEMGNQNAMPLKHSRK
eukprot:9042044-Prorocentrum_lima.AAC.1